MDEIYQHFVDGFDHAASLNGAERRIGAELKFPFVRPDGQAVSLETVDALWAYLVEHGWQPDRDALTDRVVGARRPGEQSMTCIPDAVVCRHAQTVGSILCWKHRARDRF